MDSHSNGWGIFQRPMQEVCLNLSGQKYFIRHSQNMEEKAIIWSMVVIWLSLFAIPLFVFSSSKVVDSIFQDMLLFYWFRSRAAALDPMRSVYRSDKMKEADVLLAVKDVGWIWGVAVLLKICVTSCFGLILCTMRLKRTLLLSTSSLNLLLFMVQVTVFIGPESDHWLPLSVTHSLTH